MKISYLIFCFFVFLGTSCREYEPKQKEMVKFVIEKRQVKAINDNEIVTNCAIMKNRFVFRTRQNRIFALKLDFSLDSTFNQNIEQRDFLSIFAKNDTLFGYDKKPGNYWDTSYSLPYLDNSFKWVNKTVYLSNLCKETPFGKYSVGFICFGEFGAYIQFRDCINNKLYDMPCDCVQKMTITDSSFLFYSSFKAYNFTTIWETKNPKNLADITDTITLKKYVTHYDGKYPRDYFENHAKVFFEADFATHYSFVRENEMYLFTEKNSNKKIFLQHLKNNKLTVLDSTIEETWIDYDYDDDIQTSISENVFLIPYGFVEIRNDTIFVVRLSK